MSRFILTYKDKTPLFKGNRVIAGDLLGNHLISLAKSPNYSITSTFSRGQNDYWKFRIKSNTDISITSPASQAANIESYDSPLWDITSIIATDNCVGSRWAISGGKDECLVEYSVLQNNAIPPVSQGYFCWDLDPANSTYIFIQRISSSTSSVTWIVDNLSEKVSNWSHSEGRIKIYWNRNTGVSEVWATSNDLTNPLFNFTYSTFVGSYSITNTNDPFFFYSFIDGNETNNALFVNYAIVSNYGPTFSYQSLLKEAQIAHNPPAGKYMMGQDDLY